MTEYSVIIDAVEKALAAGRTLEECTQSIEALLPATSIEVFADVDAFRGRHATPPPAPGCPCECTTAPLAVPGEAQAGRQ